MINLSTDKVFCYLSHLFIGINAIEKSIKHIKYLLSFILNHILFSSVYVFVCRSTYSIYLSIETDTFILT